MVIIWGTAIKTTQKDGAIIKLLIFFLEWNSGDIIQIANLIHCGGGKGVKICDEWLNDPKKFDIWAINNGWQDGLTIDRIDSKGNYTPENCRWVTREDNGRNIAIASMSYIVVNNISKTGRDWSKYLNLGANTINTYRKVYGIDIVKKFIKARMEDMSKEKTYNTESWLTIYNII